MKYRVRDSGDIKTRSELLNEHKNVSYPAEWNDDVYDQLGVDPVGAAEQPSTNEYQRLEEGDIVQLDDGSWVQSWNVVSIFTGYTDADGVEHSAADQEVKYKAKEARTERNKLLSESDHVVLKAVESGESVAADWVTYRQNLRDVPTQATFPETIAWPTKPTE